MTNQLVLAVVALLILLVLLFEAEETWRWRGSENRPQSRFRIVRFVRRAAGGVLAIFTLRRSSGRHTSKNDPAPMASEDVARRLGMTEQAGPVHIAPQRITVSGARPIEPIPELIPVVIVPPIAERNSRVRLLRDTVGASLVLAGFVIVAVNVVIPPPTSPPPPSGQVLEATATPFVPYVVAPATVEPQSEPPLANASIGPDPSASGTGLVSATPSPTPTDRPTPRKTPTPPPTIAPAQTQAPTATPKPTKKPTPTPKPQAVSIGTFSAGPSSITTDGGAVTFTISASNGTHYTIDVDDAGQTLSGPMSGSGPFTVDYTYGSGPYTTNINPVLTVTGLGAPDTRATTISVP